MGTKYLVIREATCPICASDGFRYNPLWMEANDAWDQAMDELIAQRNVSPDWCMANQDEWLDIYGEAIDAGVAAMREYWRDLGFNPDRPPPEEEPCYNCNGSGIVRDHVDLAEALKALGKGG